MIEYKIENGRENRLPETDSEWGKKALYVHSCGAKEQAQACLDKIQNEGTRNRISKLLDQ